MVRYVRKRRVTRRKTMRRRRVMRPRRALRNVHRFKEMCPVAALTAATSAVNTGVQSFSLSQLTNHSSFIQMFDLYKITGAKIKIVPKFNVDSPSTAQLPQLYLASNRNPFVPAATGIADILNDDTCRVYRLDKPVSWYIKSPKPDMSSSFVIGETQYTAPMNIQFGTSSKFQPWLTTGGNGQTLDQSATKHYGVRWAIDNSSGLYPVTLDVYVTLYFVCKEQD